MEKNDWDIMNETIENASGVDNILYRPTWCDVSRRGLIVMVPRIICRLLGHTDKQTVTMLATLLLITSAWSKLGSVHFESATAIKKKITFLFLFIESQKLFSLTPGHQMFKCLVF